MQNIIELDNQIYHCTRCGLCQAVCPVYDAVKSELSVARGKLSLMQGLLSGKLSYSPAISKYMELCTGCMACQEACPSGVQSEKVFLAAKVFAANSFGLSLPKQAIVKAFSSEKALHFFSTMLNLFSSVKAGHLADFAPQNFPFVDKLKLLNAQLNGKTRISLKDFHYKPDKATTKLLYFPGCINKYVNPSVAYSAIEVLKTLNCEILIPDEQFCCGLPARSSGSIEVTKALAENNLKAFDRQKISEFDHIVVDCGSCGAMLKAYPELFEENNEKQDHANLLSSKIIDINELLCKMDYKPDIQGKDLTVTYHDPCHLRRSQNIYKEPRHLIKNIPGINYVELLQADTCCGAAGSFCITNMEVSTAISEKKARNILSTGSDIVLTSCPSCKIGITQGLINTTENLPKVYHPVELIHRLSTGNY